MGNRNVGMVRHMRNLSLNMILLSGCLNILVVDLVVTNQLQVFQNNVKLIGCFCFFVLSFVCLFFIAELYAFVGPCSKYLQETILH